MTDLPTPPASRSTAPGGQTDTPNAGDERPSTNPNPSPRKAADDRNEAIATWLARQQRPVHERDLSIGKALGGIRRDLASRRRRLGDLVEPWERLVPEAIKQRTRVDGLRGDTLMVTADCAATSWQLDRLLRGGLNQSLSRASGERVRRVRVRVGSIAQAT